ASLRRVFEGFTFVRLSDVHLPKVLLELFLQRSPPRLFTAAAWSGLRPAPESRSRGAPLIFHAALRHRFQFILDSFYVSLQHTVAQEVEAFLPGIFNEVLASLSVSPSRVIALLVHAKASAAFPRLRMTKSSAYAMTCARNACPHPVSRQYFKNRFM